MVEKTRNNYQEYWNQLTILIESFIDELPVHPDYVSHVSYEIMDWFYEDSADFIIDAMEVCTVQDFEILAEGYIADIGFLNEQAKLYLIDTRRRDSVVEFIVAISNLCGFGETTDYKTLFRKL